MRGAAWVFLVAAACPAFEAGAAQAQGAADPAASEALFDDGKRLMEQGDYSHACPKLAASLRLDVGIGAMLYLAECYVYVGRTASAWAQFREAAALAASKGDPRAPLARDRAAQLEPNLSRLRVVLSGSGVPGIVVRRDGEPLESARWTSSAPVDPGVHLVEVSAPGKKPFVATVTVERDGATATVNVPVLEDSAPPASPSAPLPGDPASLVSSTTAETPPTRADSHPSSLGGQRIAALVTGGLGLVGVGVGSYAGLRAKSYLDESNSDGNCHGNSCDASGKQARSNAQTQADVADVAFSVAGGALVGAAVLWLSGSHPPAQLTVVPSVGSRTETLVLGGAF